MIQLIIIYNLNASLFNLSKRLMWAGFIMVIILSLLIAFSINVNNSVSNINIVLNDEKN